MNNKSLTTKGFLHRTLEFVNELTDSTLSHCGVYFHLVQKYTHKVAYRQKTDFAMIHKHSK